MISDITNALPARRGHFLLESGYHAGLWLALDELFTDPAGVEPLVAALAERIRPHGAVAVCGPLVGGAFLAQSLAAKLGVRFYYAEPVLHPPDGGLFRASYRLPSALSLRIRGQSVAVVDDVISAGSSVRATLTALDAAGASTAVIAALAVLGDRAFHHFAERGIPVETLERRAFETWAPSDCPLCLAGRPLEDRANPTSVRV